MKTVRNITNSIVKLAIVLANLQVARICLGQQCPQEFSKSWTGFGPDNFWSSDENWLPVQEPQQCDHVFITTAANTIMDRPPSGSQRRILSLTVSAAGETALEDAAGLSDSRLYCVRDLRRSGGINDHLIRLGPLDRAFVGDALANPPGNGTALGFNWDVAGTTPTGGPEVTVAGTIGCGHWIARNAEIGVGFRVPTGQELTGAPGTIDTNVCDVPGGIPPLGRRWELQGVTLRARRAQNLGVWTVQQAVGARANDLQFTEYLQANEFFFEGAVNSKLNVLFPGDDPSNPQVDEGLHVLNAMHVAGPTDSALAQGPKVQTERLLVGPQAKLVLSDGAEFQVREDDHFLTAPAGATFEDEASLQYGPFYAQSLTLFEVQDWGAGPGRVPPLAFKGNSFITTALPIDPIIEGFNQELEMHLHVHLDIEGELSRPPAIAWHTGEVDLVVGSSAVGNPPPLKLEVIAADSCNLWFTDIPEPRCLKHWRSLTVHARDGPLGPEMKLVDRHDNYPSSAAVCESTDFPEAMYVKQNVIIHNHGPATVDLNHLRLYYGGELITRGPGAFTRGWPILLLHTEYGDFNGDCVVDEADETWLPAGLRRGAGEISTAPVHATLPILDYDGDCDVDEVEIGLFYQRLDARYPTRGCTGGAAGIGLVCPPRTSLTRTPLGLADGVSFGRIGMTCSDSVDRAVGADND